MSAQAFNRIAALEKHVRELLVRVEKLEKQAVMQACEAERPHTLSLKPKKAETSHA